MAQVPAKRSVPAVIRDGFVNLVNSLGTTKDARSQTQYSLTILAPDQLLTAYRSNWLARRIVNCVAEDATREWRTWQASEDQVELLEKAEKDLGLQQKLRMAYTRARLFGGAALIMGIDGAGDASEELDLDRVGQDALKFVLVMSSYEMTRGQMIVDANSPWFGRPEYYEINTGRADLGDAQAATRRIHPSRVVELIGAEIPSWDVVNGGSTWGDSVLQAVDETLKDYGTSLSSIATLISDCKVDVFTIPGLTKKIANKEFERNLFTRLTASNTMKSTINAMVMDENEKWERVQTQFAGLPPLMQELLKVACGAAGIPMSRLVGHGSGSGASGIGSSGGAEGDMRSYYDSVTSTQKTEYSVALAPMDEVLKRSALGTDDESVYYEWTPLYTPDPNQEADIAVKYSQVLTADVGAGLINPDVLRRARINQLIEHGTYPGLQDAVDEFGEEPEEPAEPDQAAVEEHIGMLQRSSQKLQQIGKAAQPALPAPKKPVTDDGSALRTMRMFR